MSLSLNGSVVKVVTRWDNMYDYDITIDKSRGNSSLKLVGGYAYNILEELAQHLNFSYVLHPEVGSYEFEKADSHGIDIYAASYSLYESRAKIIDPTFVTGSSKVVALLNHDFESGMSFSVLDPFSNLLWIFVLLFSIIICCIFAMLGIVEKFSTFGERVFYAIAILLQKGTNCQLVNYKTKCIAWIVMIGSFILMNSYSASMVSQIAVRPFRINNLEHLLNSDYRLLLERGFNNGSAIQTIAEALTHLPIMNLLLQKAKKSNFIYESFEKSIKMVQKTQSAYIIDEETAFSSVANSDLGHLPCSWSTLSVAGIHYPWSMFVRKKWPYKAAFNSGLVLLHQYGLLQRNRNRWISRQTECFASLSSNDNGLSLGHLNKLFVIYGIGALIAAAILFIVERNVIFNKFCLSFYGR